MENSILLVDDEEDIRLVLAMALSDLGYQVWPAENGEQGWSVFQEKMPPIVITDIKMPDIDGIDLLRRIKDKNPDTEVIMITGHGDMDSAIESFQHEATDFITKPINVEVLEASLRRVRERIAGRQSLRDYTNRLEALVHQKTRRLAEVEKRLETEEGPTGVRPLIRGLFDELPCFLAVIDERCRLIAVNQSFSRSFGQAEGGYCYETARGRDEPCPDCPAAAALETSLPQQVELEWISRRGEKIRVLVMVAPLAAPDDDDRRAAILALEMSRVVQVRDRLSHLGLVVGSICHGIKGLLTGLDAGLYYLESGLGKEEAPLIDQGLDMVKQTQDRIRNMVTDILMFSKDRPPAFKSVSLSQFAQGLIEGMLPRLHRNNIDLRLNIEPGDGRVTVDPELLRTALTNILDNAVDACQADRQKPGHWVRLAARTEPGGAVFEIGDNGGGMDEDTLDRIFTLFFSSKGSKGTGLGLYVAREIIRQHGGEIRAESTPGAGTSFKITVKSAASGTGRE